MPRIKVQDIPYSLSFQTASSKVNIGNTFDWTGDVTALLWVNMTGDGSGTGGRILDNSKYVLRYDPGTRTLKLFSDGGTTPALSGIMPKNRWVPLSVTRTAAGVVNYRINFALSGSENQPSGTPTTTVVDMCIGNYTADGKNWAGNMSKVIIYNSILTAQEQDSILATGNIIGTPLRHYKLTEGSGTTATDSSGNNNNGTITNGTWSTDTPTKLRRPVGGNLVYNGGFEYAPPTNVAYESTTGKWIDGSAGGSTSNIFGWYQWSGVGSPSVIFDNTEKHSGSYSLKLSTKATGSRVEISNVSAASSAAMVNAFRIQPSTSYTYSYWMKTNYVSGSAAYGATIQFKERDAAGANVQTTTPTKVLTTTDWTQYTGTFTSSATSLYMCPSPTVQGTDGAATLIMDAWFDDITLKPTTPNTRVAVQDVKSSLSFNGTSSKVDCGAFTDFNGVQAYSVGMWVKPSGTQINNAVLASLTNVFRIIKPTSASGWIFGVGTASSAWVTDTTTFTLPTIAWTHITATYNGSKVKLYRNGVNIGETSITGNTLSATANLFLGTDNGAQRFFNGSISGFFTAARTLSDSEILSMYTSSAGFTTSMARCFTLQEGAGTTAYDSSGNGNHGTITSGTFTSDVPTKKRGVVGGNLVYNGDFEYAPPFVAAATGGSRWIDGTAVGSTTNNLFGWATGTLTGTASVMIDTSVSYDGTASLKLSTSATGSSAFAFNVQSLIASQMRYAIPVLPSTSYTYSFMMKTNVVSGSAATGAQLQWKGRDATATNVGLAVSTAVATTTEWTRYTGTFTTHANARYMTIQLGVTGSDGAGTLIMDAWFDDIELRPTTPTTRTAV